MADQTNEERTNKGILKGIIIVPIFLVGVGTAFFLPYGGFDWWEAWLLLGLWMCYFVLMLTVNRKRNPGLVLCHDRVSE